MTLLQIRPILTSYLFLRLNSKYHRFTASNRYTAFVQTRSSTAATSHLHTSCAHLNPASNHLPEVVYKPVCEPVPKSVQCVYTWGSQAGSTEIVLGTGLNTTCKRSYSLTRIGCLIDWKKERRQVSLISEGFPSLASMNLPAIPVPILAVQIPNATRVRPAALMV